MNKILTLSDMEIDALKEMGNIGTGNATTSLSKFLNKNIDMGIPETRFIPITEFSAEVGGPEEPVSAIYLDISGDLHGEAVFIFSKKSALQAIDILMGRNAGDTKVMDEMEESAFKEMSNIIAGSFLTSLSEMLDIKILPSIPYIADDMAQAVLDMILIKVSRYANELLSIKTQINVEKHNIKADFFILFDTASLKKMLILLHQKYGGLYE